MLYIGYKKKSLDFISETLKDYCTFPLKIVADLFAGTGVVSFYLGNLPDTEHIVSNDIQYYSYVLLRAQLENHSHHILPGENVKKGFIYDNYAVDRRYFTPDNAQLIDGYRSVINNDDYYSIASLLVGVSEISNTACMYESYLKSYKKSSLKKLELRPMENGVSCSFDILCEDVNAIDYTKYPVFDLVYLDPPHNRRKFSTNYHILETIARYDDPPIKGKSGIRDETIPSDFNKKKTSKKAFVSLLNKIRCRILALSYVRDGIISLPNWEEILEMTGFVNVRVYQHPHKPKEILLMATKKIFI